MSLLDVLRNEAGYAAKMFGQRILPYTGNENRVRSGAGTGRGRGRGGSGRGRPGTGTRKGGSGGGFNARTPAPGSGSSASQRGTARGGSGRGFNPGRPAPGTTVRPTTPITNPLQGIQQGFSNLQTQAGQAIGRVGQGIGGLQTQAGQVLRSAGQGIGQFGNTIYNAAAGQFSPYSRAVTAGPSPLPRIVSTARNALAPVGSFLGGTAAAIAGAPGATGALIAGGLAVASELALPRRTNPNDTLDKVSVTEGGNRPVPTGAKAVLNGLEVVNIGNNPQGKPTWRYVQDPTKLEFQQPGMTIAGRNGPVGTVGFGRIVPGESFIPYKEGQPRFGDVDTKTGRVYAGPSLGWQTRETFEESKSMNRLYNDIFGAYGDVKTTKEILEAIASTQEMANGDTILRLSRKPSEVYPGLKQGQEYAVLIPYDIRKNDGFSTIVRHGERAEIPLESSNSSSSSNQNGSNSGRSGGITKSGPGPSPVRPRIRPEVPQFTDRRNGVGPAALSSGNPAGRSGRSNSNFNQDQNSRSGSPAKPAAPAPRPGVLAPQPRDAVNPRDPETIVGAGPASFNPGGSVGNTGTLPTRFRPDTGPAAGFAINPGASASDATVTAADPSLTQVLQPQQKSDPNPIIQPPTVDLNQQVIDSFNSNFGNISEQYTKFLDPGLIRSRLKNGFYGNPEILNNLFTGLGDSTSDSQQISSVNEGRATIPEPIFLDPERILRERQRAMEAAAGYQQQQLLPAPQQPADSSQPQIPGPNRQQNIPFTREDMLSAATSLTAPTQIYSSTQNEYVPFALKDYYTAQQVLGTQNMQDNLNRLGYEQANRPDLAAWAKANPRLAQQLVNRSMIGG